MIVRDITVQIELTSSQFPADEFSTADVLVVGMGLSPEEIEPLIELVVKRMLARCRLDPALAEHLEVAVDAAVPGWVDGFVTGYNLARRGL